MNKFLIPILVIIVAYKYLSTEYFVSNINTINKQIIYNIIPSFDNTYIASTIPDNKSNLCILIYTRSVKSNEWRGRAPHTRPHKLDEHRLTGEGRCGAGLPLAVPNLPFARVDL